LGDFFPLGDSFVFFGDLGDLAFGDSLFFFGDLVVLAFAALAFFGDVESFLVLVEVVDFLDEEDVEVEGFFVTVLVVAFFGDLVDGDFLGDLAVVVDDFFELDVDLFFGDDGAVVEVPDVACVEVVEEVDVFFAEVFFFFFSKSLAAGASLYEAFTFTNKTPSLRLRASLICLRAVSGSIL